MNPTKTYTESDVADYGWDTSEPGTTCYLNPKVLDMIAAIRPARILDIGCGNGILCAQIRQAGYTVVGIDFDQTGVNLACNTYADIPFYCFGVQDDPAELLAREAPFDLVVSTEVVEHLFAPHLLMNYASAVLTTGGHLLVSTPFHGYWKNLLLAILGKWDSHHMPLWHGGHIKFWCRATLGQLFVNSGYHITDFQGVGRIRHLWKSMIMVGRKL